MLLDWILSFTEGSVKLCKLRCTDTTAQVDFCVVIKDDLSWVLTYRDNVVDGTKCSAMCEAPHVMNSGIIFYMFYCMLPLVEKVTTLLLMAFGNVVVILIVTFWVSIAFTKVLCWINQVSVACVCNVCMPRIY